MGTTHVCYMEGGSIINAFSGGIVERPAILVSKEAQIPYKASGRKFRRPADHIAGHLPGDLIF